MGDKAVNVFLTYVNSSLYDDSGNLLRTYDRIEQQYGSQISQRTFDLLRPMVRNMADVDQTTDSSSILQWVAGAQEGGGSGFLARLYARAPSTAAYGFINNYCERKCPDRTKRPFIEDEQFQGGNRLLCYECDQLAFVGLIREVLQGKDYLEISVFSEFVERGNRCVSGKPIIIVKNDLGSHLEYGERNEPHEIWFEAISSYEDDDNGNRYMGAVLRNFILGLVCRSLFDFLVANDRGRLKVCEECRRLTVAKRRRSSKQGLKYDFCSKVCKAAFHNRRKDPERQREVMRNYRRECAEGFQPKRRGGECRPR